VFKITNAWSWDFWLARDGATYHLFFLQASRALHDPDRRHYRAGIGHAVSADLRQWTQVDDALVHDDRPAFDDIATWTGSVIRRPDGLWCMFYTGVGSRDDGLVQRIGLATSADLTTWTRHPTGPVLQADPRWYEQLGGSSWPNEAWRDPWVFADPAGDGWHMLITARADHGPVDDRGVIGHARSADLVHWQAQPPLTTPGSGFGQLEVPQVELVDGCPVLLFSCLQPELSSARRVNGETGGIWAVTGDSLLGPFDTAKARRVTDESLYAGRMVKDPHGQWQLLAFHNTGADGRFIGGLSDPMPLLLTDGTLEADTTTAAAPC
jgi:beta-fructofuranosidase